MIVPGVDDATEFASTCVALGTLGISDSDQHQLFCALAAVLHLGNVELTATSRRCEDAKVKDSDTCAITAARLLGVNHSMLVKWITNRNISTGKEVFTKPMMVDEAIRTRDALAKHVYASFFDWVVASVNKSLMHSGQSVNIFIGVLDIYGFETFQINSFEQFCINYANEKLQQQFNQHVFKLEQAEYVKEGISWNFIDYCDNQPCIDLIEDRQGVLALLDEECKVPKGADTTWALKLYNQVI